jgi:hypothetical protein
MQTFRFIYAWCGEMFFDRFFAGNDFLHFRCVSRPMIALSDDSVVVLHQNKVAPWHGSSC